MAMVEANEAPEQTDLERTKSQSLSTVLENLKSKYQDSIREAQTKAASTAQESWNGYWRSVTDITAQATKAWIDSYAAYIEAYRNLPPKPDDSALRTVVDAWAAHVAACGGSPDLINAWSTTYQNTINELHKTEQSVTEAVAESGKSYLENVRAVLSAHGLVDLDTPTARLVIEQIAAFNHGAVG